MDWWSLFRRLRKVIFGASIGLRIATSIIDRFRPIGFVALASLVWAIVLSLYLSKQWNAFTVLQRECCASHFLDTPTSMPLGSIVLSLICVNGVTAVLIYLM